MTLRNRKRPDGFKNVAPIGKRDIIVWTDRAGEPRSAPADKGATKLELQEAQLSRQPTKYQHRGYYEGFYWFAGTGNHVWHESMTEYTALMWWDHHYDIQAIAAQPMCLMFADGSRHYPDYFAVHADGAQVLYDVRPAELIDDKARAQFEKTASLCRKVGWRYEIFDGIDRVTRHNLEWLAGFRQSRHRATPETTSRVHDFLNEGKPLRDVARLLDFKSPARHIGEVFNLMWNREVEFDISELFTPTTPIWKA